MQSSRYPLQRAEAEDVSGDGVLRREPAELAGFHAGEAVPFLSGAWVFHATNRRARIPTWYADRA